MKSEPTNSGFSKSLNVAELAKSFGRPMLALWIVLALATARPTCAEQPRVWSDKTGRFKVTGTLVEVQSGFALIKNKAGKTMKVPIARLSQEDQDFLASEESPFEMVADDETSTAANATSTITAKWAAPRSIDWDQADQLLTIAESEWKVPDINGELDFQPKRTALPAKDNFHEKLHPVVVNANTQQAIVGHSVSFAVPKPVTRLSLVNLQTGKAINCKPVEAEMRPLALLNDGQTVLMVGASRGGYSSTGETSDQLQLWSLQGKNIIRSASWIPYENEDRNGTANADVMDAAVVDDQHVITTSSKGHVVLWNLAERTPIWHARLSERNFATSLSLDRKTLALFDETTLMMVDPMDAKILGSTSLPANSTAGFNRLAWSPLADKLLVASMNDLRVLDVKTGQWIQEVSFPGGPIAANGLSYPHDDYAWVNQRLLLHLPSKIQVCDYRSASSVTTIGGTSLVAVSAKTGGLLMPTTLPQDSAVSILQKAKDDPTLFLIHPGVSVAIDVANIKEDLQSTVRKGLEASAKKAGYTIDDASPIKLVATISDPKEEATRYIAAGSYIVTRYTSTVALKWDGKFVWSRRDSNIPTLLMTKRGQTMEEALDEASKKPNTDIFATARLPEFLQKPNENSSKNNRSGALMTAEFTLRGLVDTP